MGIIKAGISNVQAPNGGGLAIYIDSMTSEVMLKDINGNVESLSNFLKSVLKLLIGSSFQISINFFTIHI
jgi:hypothetical protein